MPIHDLYLVIGIIVTGFSLPAVLGAIADRRAPRVATLTVLIGGSLIMLALSQKQGGYTWHQIPEAFVNVLAHFIR